jgi:predicted transcriptional regulator
MTFGSFQKAFLRLYDTMSAVKRLIGLKLKESGYKQNIIARELDISTSSLSMAISWKVESVDSIESAKAARGKKVFDLKLNFPRTIAKIEEVKDFDDIDTVLAAYLEESIELLREEL